MKPGRKGLMYIAGPYSGTTPRPVLSNVRLASAWAGLMAKRGWVPVVPHLWHYMQEEARGFSYEDWIALGLALLRRCDAILMIPGWQESTGARGELALAQKLGLKTYFCGSDETIRRGK